MIHIKFSMKDISDWDEILTNFQRAGFIDYSIENFDFFGEGIYTTELAVPDPEKPCTTLFKRGSIAITNNDLLTLIDAYSGGKFKVYKEDNNI